MRGHGVGVWLRTVAWRMRTWVESVFREEESDFAAALAQARLAEESPRPAASPVVASSSAPEPGDAASSPAPVAPVMVTAPSVNPATSEQWLREHHARRAAGPTPDWVARVRKVAPHLVENLPEAAAPRAVCDTVFPSRARTLLVGALAELPVSPPMLPVVPLPSAGTEPVGVNDAGRVGASARSNAEPGADGPVGGGMPREVPRRAAKMTLTPTVPPLASTPVAETSVLAGAQPVSTALPPVVSVLASMSEGVVSPRTSTLAMPAHVSMSVTASQVAMLAMPPHASMSVMAPGMSVLAIPPHASIPTSSVHASLSEVPSPSSAPAAHPSSFISAEFSHSVGTPVSSPAVHPPVFVPSHGTGPAVSTFASVSAHPPVPRPAAPSHEAGLAASSRTAGLTVSPPVSMPAMHPPVSMPVAPLLATGLAASACVAEPTVASPASTPAMHPPSSLPAASAHASRSTLPPLASLPPAFVSREQDLLSGNGPVSPVAAMMLRGAVFTHPVKVESTPVSPSEVCVPPLGEGAIDGGLHAVGFTQGFSASQAVELQRGGVSTAPSKTGSCSTGELWIPRRRFVDELALAAGAQASLSRDGDASSARGPSLPRPSRISASSRAVQVGIAALAGGAESMSPSEISSALAEEPLEAILDRRLWKRLRWYERDQLGE